MSPVSVVPQVVPAPRVHRLPTEEAEGPVRVQHVPVPRVPAPVVVPHLRTG